MKHISFEKTSSNNYSIIIDGKKAGYLEPMSSSEFVSNGSIADWRVFFWGRYNRFQVDTSLFKKHTGEKVTLQSVMDRIQYLFTNNPELLFAAEKYEKKGNVFLHATNGQILTISTEYEYTLTEFYSLHDRYGLFDTEEKLKEISTKVVDKYSDGSWWFGEITKVEFKMFESIFDISYYGEE